MYATLADVQALNPARVITGQSRPNSSQVWDFLTETALELDGVMRAQGYALPVAATATQALRLLQMWNAHGAHARVEAAAPNSNRRDTAEALWAAAKKMLAEGMVELPEVGRDADETHARYATTATGTVPSPFFSREMVL